MEILSAEQTSQRLSYPALAQAIADVLRTPGARAVERVQMPLREFELLSLLISRQGIVFTRAQLLDEIWGYGFDGESRTVDVHIRTLRQKLGSAGSYIETVRGIGYKIGGEKE